MTRKSGFALWGVAAALVLACAVGWAAPVEGQKKAPDFTLTTLEGTKVRLADFKGKVVFVNLWATWCPPCRQEMPSMVKFYETFRGQGVEILAVSEDHDLGAVRKFVKANGITFPVLPDEGKQVFRLYGGTGVPETHLIDKNGVLQASQLGPFDWTHPSVTDKVRALLAR